MFGLLPMETNFKRLIPLSLLRFTLEILKELEIRNQNNNFLFPRDNYNIIMHTEKDLLWSYFVKHTCAIRSIYKV